ncbi:MAG: Bax inhibitor-1/YccA family protein [Campylobacteraceae bacterium]|jgi:modulator of FtsH protease|nr:Bax inhibitor-1/YccA family protein [Campylobacteraceae bacterium]
MALYDRDYANENLQTGEVGVQSKSALSIFIKKTYQLFAASLLAGSAGAYVGLDFAYQLNQFGLWMLVPLFAFLIALHFAKKVNGLNYLLLFAFTFTSGLTIAPLIFAYISMGAGQIVVNAFVLTTVAFGGLSVFAMNTKRNFSTWGKALFIILIVAIAALFLNYFFVESTIFSLVISSVCAVLFSAYILYDTQNIIKGAYETPIEGAIALYLDFLNLFIHLLNILGIFNSND